MVIFYHFLQLHASNCALQFVKRRLQIPINRAIDRCSSCCGKKTAAKCGEAFRQAVRDERGRELAFEALRKYDLIRWGIYVSTIRDNLGAATKDKRWTNGTDPANKFGGAAVFAQRTADKHQFLPIPERELGVNTLLKQNKYWSSASSE